MKHLFLSVIVMLMGAFMVSCSDDDSVASELSTDQTEVTYSSDRAVQSILVTATTNWNVVTDVTWINLTKTSYEAAENNIAFILDANLASEARVGHIVVTSGDKQLMLTITQEGITIVKLSQEDYYIPCLGGQLNVNITTNVDLEVEIEGGDGWLQFDQIKGAGTEFPVLQFTAAENTTDFERAAVVTIKDVNSEASQTLTITQKEQDTFEVIDGTVREVAGNESSIVSFDIMQNVDYVEFISDRSWIAPHKLLTDEVKGGDNTIIEKTILYDITANEGYDEREGTILLTNAANGEELAFLTVKQSGNPRLELISTSFNKDKDKYSADAINKSYVVELNTNVKEVLVSPSEEWITYAKSVGGFTLIVAKNETTAAREAIVTFADPNGKAEPIVMTIVQKKP